MSRRGGVSSSCQVVDRVARVERVEVAGHGRLLVDIELWVEENAVVKLDLHLGAVEHLEPGEGRHVLCAFSHAERHGLHSQVLSRLKRQQGCDVPAELVDEPLAATAEADTP